MELYFEGLPKIFEERTIFTMDIKNIENSIWSFDHLNSTSDSRHVHVQIDGCEEKCIRGYGKKPMRKKKRQKDYFKVIRRTEKINNTRHN